MAEEKRKKVESLEAKELRLEEWKGDLERWDSQLSELEEDLTAKREQGRADTLELQQATLSLTEAVEAFDKKSIETIRQLSAREAGVKKGEATLATRSTKVGQSEAEVSLVKKELGRKERGLISDISFMVRVVNILTNGEGKDKKLILSEFGEHRWQVIEESGGQESTERLPETPRPKATPPLKAKGGGAGGFFKWVFIFGGGGLALWFFTRLVIDLVNRFIVG